MRHDGNSGRNHDQKKKEQQQKHVVVCGDKTYIIQTAADTQMLDFNEKWTEWHSC